MNSISGFSGKIAAVSKDIGKQKRSQGTLSWIPAIVKFALVLIIAFFILPEAVSASGYNYLEQNAPTFIDKTNAKYGQMVDIAALLNDYDKKLILSVIIIESEGNVQATSHRGAQGLMQLMPETAKGLGVKDSNDPLQNILAGTKYLKQLQNSYGFDSPQEALVAYNMGPSRAKRWLSQYSAEDYGYVQKVMYVYGVLAENEKQKDQLAEAIKNKIDESNKLTKAPLPMLSKPRSLSLAAFPMTIPAGQKRETETEN